MDDLNNEHLKKEIKDLFNNDKKENDIKISKISENINTSSENLSNNIPIKTQKKFDTKKLILPLGLGILLIGILGFFTLSYKSLLNDFKSYFDKSNYATANNLLVSKGNINLIKAIKLDKDLKTYFKEKLSLISSDLDSNKINSDEALIVINEINRYNVLSNEIDEAMSVLSNNVSKDSTLSQGILEFQNKNFEKSLEILKSIPPNHESYSIALNYITKNKNSFKEELLKEADLLINERYYSKAIDMLSEKLPLIDSDPTILTKIEEIKDGREEYLKSQATSPDIPDDTQNHSSNNSEDKKSSSLNE